MTKKSNAVILALVLICLSVAKSYVQTSKPSGRGGLFYFEGGKMASYTPITANSLISGMQNAQRPTGYNTQYGSSYGSQKLQGPLLPNGSFYSGSGGQTLGTKSTKPITSSSGGGSSSSSGGGSNNNSGQDQAQAEADRQRRELEASIGSGWDSYISGLDAQLGGLNTQRSAQESVIGSQYNTGVNDLGLQLGQGQQDLARNRAAAEQNQVGNLRDIAGNIRNAFQAGNVYLGARGAGDSSAANQYSYALNKMGTQQRSDVMQNTANILADVDARESDLKNTYNTEVNNLGEQKNQAIQQVGMWFADAQNQIKQLQNEGRLNKAQDIQALSRDLLNQALQKVNQIEAFNMNRKAQLDQWAMGVSENINQLRSNMQSVSSVSYDLPQSQRFNGAPQVDSSGNMMTNFGGGGSVKTDEDRLFRGF